MLLSFLLLVLLLMCLPKAESVQTADVREDINRLIKSLTLKNKNFLVAFVKSFGVLFGALKSKIFTLAQTNLFSIRQVLNSILFGRGVLHS